MQRIKFLERILEEKSSGEHFVFARDDFKAVFPCVSEQNLNMLLSRATKAGILQRVCKGIYFYPKSRGERSLVLFKAAQKLRVGELNYISLESVLSERSLISQQMPACVTIMTTGRSGEIDCGEFGRIEFVHTQKDFAKIAENLFVDERAKMLKATAKQALRDMISARRSTLDLVDFAELQAEAECERV